MTPAPQLLPLSDLLPEEAQAVQALLSSKAQLSEAIPDEIPADDLWKTLTACCKSLSACRHAVSQLKPAIGRLLLILQDRPEIYKAHGYSNYDDLMTRGMRDILGVPRSEAYAAVRLVQKWPSLGLSDFKACTYSKIMEISKYTDESQPSAQKWLTAAQTHTLDELRDLAANNGILPRADADFASITILTTKSVKDSWTEFHNDPQVRAYVGSDDPGTILEMALAEARAFWLSQAMVQMQDQGEA